MPHIDWSGTHSGYELPAKVTEGSRNDEMHRYLSSLRGKGATDEQVESAALAVNATNFEPPIQDAELRSIVRSVCTYEVGDGSYHGDPLPKVLPSANIPTITRSVDPSVLPDLRHMEPVEQAKAFIRACFNGSDVADTTGGTREEFAWTDTICLTRNYAAPWDDAYEYAGTLLGMCGYEALDRYLPNVEGAGMWCCVNPLLPNRYKRNRDSVAEYRNLLVECDTLPLEQQLERMLSIFWGRGLLRAITYSGGKSYHCIIRTGSRDRQTYAVDANFVYDICDHNGLPVDRKCANPTRLTRFPGAMRGDVMQRLVWADGV